MEIKFVGTGGAFEPHKGNSAAIVEHEGPRVLIDCGYATLERLITKDLVKDLDYILITHPHGDHVGSLPTFVDYAYHILSKDIPIIYATEEHKADIEAFLTITWANEHAHYVPMGDFPWIGHIDTFGLHKSGKQSFAYYFVEDGDVLFYSGDLGHIEPIETFLAEHRDKNVKIFIDMNKAELPVHLYYKEVEKHLKGYEVYGYHCDIATMPKDRTLSLVEEIPELNY